MRTIEYGTTTHVPAFLTKLWKLVTDMSCDDLISWNPSGTSFIIYDEIRFSKELLPMYFKHNNMASFVRQLNMYGFRKLSTVDQGGMHCFKNEIEFRHPHFIRGREDYLELIKRKIPNSKSDDPRVKQEYIDELISNIKSLKGKQENSDQGMRHLKRENKALWRHIHVLADRYHKQQAVLQQLVPFFMNMVRSSREVALKRKAPLMIDEGDMQAKLARLSPPYYVEHNDQDQITSIPSSPGNVTNRGPVIHDVTELESSKMFPGNILCSPNTSPKEIEAIVDSPLSCSLESSEQTIDSPFTEPGSVKTLNILNHSFERSNSLSPHMDAKQSSVSSSSPLHLPSQVCAMPTSPTSVRNYSPVSNGIPPVTIIDETTSDVPLSSNLMANPFVPKIEDTCSESNLYTMDPIVNDRVTMISRQTITNETTSSIVGEGTSSMINGNTVMRERSSSIMNGSTVMIEGSPSIMNRNAMREGSLPVVNGNSVMREGSLPVVNGNSVMREGSLSVVNGNAVMREGSPSIINGSTIVREGTPSVIPRNAVMREGSSAVLNRNGMMREKASTVLSGNTGIRERTSSMINQNPGMREGTPSLLDTNAIIREGTSSIINESASGSSQNKFFPSFPSSSRSTSANEQWLLNQDASGTNIDNWLGQIFKSDNLIAGCSLPQNI